MAVFADVSTKSAVFFEFNSKNCGSIVLRVKSGEKIKCVSKIHSSAGCLLCVVSVMVRMFESPSSLIERVQIVFLCSYCAVMVTVVGNLLMITGFGEIGSPVIEKSESNSNKFLFCANTVE